MKKFLTNFTLNLVTFAGLVLMACSHGDGVYYSSQLQLQIIRYNVNENIFKKELEVQVNEYDNNFDFILDESDGWFLPDSKIELLKYYYQKENLSLPAENFTHLSKRSKAYYQIYENNPILFEKYNKTIIDSFEKLMVLYPINLLPSSFRDDLLKKYTLNFFQENFLILYRANIWDQYTSFRNRVDAYRINQVTITNNTITTNIIKTARAWTNVSGAPDQLFTKYTNYLLEIKKNDLDLSNLVINFSIEQ